MGELFQWIATNGNALSVSGILAVNLVFITLALVRQWVVPGWIYRECLIRELEFKKSVNETVDEMKLKVERQEVEIERLRNRPRSR